MHPAPSTPTGTSTQTCSGSTIIDLDLEPDFDFDLDFGFDIDSTIIPATIITPFTMSSSKRYSQSQAPHYYTLKCCVCGRRVDPPPANKAICPNSRCTHGSCRFCGLVVECGDDEDVTLPSAPGYLRAPSSEPDVDVGLQDDKITKPVMTPGPSSNVRINKSEPPEKRRKIEQKNKKQATNRNTKKNTKKR